MRICDNVEGSREGVVMIITGLEGIAWVEAGLSYSFSLSMYRRLFNIFIERLVLANLQLGR